MIHKVQYQYKYLWHKLIIAEKIRFPNISNLLRKLFSFKRISQKILLKCIIM